MNYSETLMKAGATIFKKILNQINMELELADIQGYIVRGYK